MDSGSSRTYSKGDAKITYTTTRKPGHTKLVATRDNEVRAQRAHERILKKAKRGEAAKQKAERTANRKKTYSASRIRKAKR